MYVLSDLPPDLDKQGSPMIPPPAWFGPGITWDLPVKDVKSSGLGRFGSTMCGGDPLTGEGQYACPKSWMSEDKKRVIRTAYCKPGDTRPACAGPGDYQKTKKFLPAILVATALAWYLSKRRS